jgi:predicted  nucleic acid-binding Zn-ribbon protein
MLTNIRIAIGVALLLLAAFAGYEVGAWRLGKAQAEIAQFKQAGDEALKSAQAAQARLNDELAKLSKEQADKEQAMTAQFKADLGHLDDSLKSAGKRTASLEDQRASGERKTGQLQKEIDELRRRPVAPAAAGADPAAAGTDAISALEAERDRTLAENKRLTDQIAGLKCEDSVIPDLEWADLNRSARTDVIGAPQ